MIANAVPAPVAASIGRVILDREAGKTAPAIEGRFVRWLTTTRGRSPQSAWNVKSLAGRARRLLDGRTFFVPALELAALESVEDFRAMKKNTQSDLRQALRLLAEYQSDAHQIRQKPTANPQPLADAA
jgi:DNA (cytosine-5)-methyltransferase 1